VKYVSLDGKQLARLSPHNAQNFVSPTFLIWLAVRFRQQLLQICNMPRVACCQQFTHLSKANLFSYAIHKNITIFQFLQIRKFLFL